MMHRPVSKKKSPLNSETPSGLLLNKRELSEFREIAGENENVEYLYLRENEFVEFKVGCPLPKLKVLDLSINNLQAITFAEDTPYLRHLYLTGNRLTNFDGLTELKQLETLCLSDNDITSFEGFGEWENLRVLSLNFNKIESLQHYGCLPNLRTINLRGNPVADHGTYRQMVIAASSPALSAIDMEQVAEEERAQVDFFKGKIQFCLGEGMILEGDQPEAQADKFIWDLNHANAGENVALKLIYTRVAPEEAQMNIISENQPVRLHVCLQDVRPFDQRTAGKFTSRHIVPVQFSVTGESNEVFLVGEMNGWGEPIPMEKRTEGDEVSFETTLYLPVGEYEYRYIVNGQETYAPTADLVQSKFNQGMCNIQSVKEIAAAAEENERTILYVRWTRSNESGGYDEIPGENLLSYTPKPADVGYCYRPEVLGYTDGDYSFLYFDVSTPVAAGKPMCTKLSLDGEAAEGHAITVDARYSGGVQGQSVLRWMRVTPEGEEQQIEMPNPWSEAGYVCGLDDIGCKIKVEYTPVRQDNEAGTVAIAYAGPVKPGVAACRSLSIAGDLREGSLLVAEAEYSGGFEGSSRYQWFRLDDSTQQFIPIAGETQASYTITVEDVRKRLAVEYTPVSQQGVAGEANRCECADVITAAKPSITDVKLGGNCAEEGMMTVEHTYYGGFPGIPEIKWFAEKKSGDKLKIGKNNHTTVTLTRNEVNATISVEITPVRDDGMKGKAVVATAPEPVRAGDPEIRELKILPKVDPPVEGTVLELSIAYFGGDAGDHEILWEVGQTDENGWETVAKMTKVYVVAGTDLGRMLRVTVTPVRKDGVKGDPKIRLLEIPGPEPEETIAEEEDEGEAPAAAETADAEEEEEEQVDAPAADEEDVPEAPPAEGEATQPSSPQADEQET